MKADMDRKKLQAADAEAECSAYVSEVYAAMHW